MIVLYVRMCCGQCIFIMNAYSVEKKKKKNTNVS